MDYVFQFGVVWRDFDALLLGAWLTVRLSALAMALGLVVGVAGALATVSRWRAGRESLCVLNPTRPGDRCLRREPIPGR